MNIYVCIFFYFKVVCLNNLVNIKMNETKSANEFLHYDYTKKDS